jgi:general secretion pathway protein A
VRHRLRVAGGEGKVAFTQNALDAVHAHAQGIPRLVNSLCDRALLAGYVQGARVIDGRMVRQAAREVRGAPERSARPFLAWAGAAAVVAAGAWLLGGRLLRDGAPAAAASPLPADTPAAVSSPGPPTASRLEEAVRTLPREASYRAALERVRSLWGGEALQYTTLRTHLDQVRRLNLPAVLEMFHPSRRDTCFVALLALEGGAAEVLAGETLRVEAAEMDRYWTREAVFVWRDFDRVALDPARGPAWTRETLQRLGFLGDEADTTPAVRRFQQDAQLLSDGVVGSRTLLALYSRTTHPQPRLRGGLP